MECLDEKKEGIGEKIPFEESFNERSHVRPIGVKMAWRVTYNTS